MRDDEIAIDEAERGDHAARGGDHGGPPPFRRPPAPRRPWGLLAAASLLLILLLAVVALVPPLRDLTARRLARPTATPIFVVADAETATATANEWALLESRPLNLPTMAPGAPCPRMAARQVTPSLGPALGSGPAYAISSPSSVVMFASPKQFGGGVSAWGG
jgi:hypothetical protein